MRNILQTIERIAVSDLGVLLVGEHGTEKEWLAHMIHQRSGRADHPFLQLECSSIQPKVVEKEILGYEELSESGPLIKQSVFEIAFGGTIFFNQFSDLPYPLQRKIASILKHQHFRRVNGTEELISNNRVILALNTEAMVTDQNVDIRRDLYCSICPITINISPLRERPEDIPSLIERFINELSCQCEQRPKGITAEALRICLQYSWPGNAKELFGAIEHAIRSCSDQFIQKEHLPYYLRERVSNQKKASFEELVKS